MNPVSQASAMVCVLIAGFAAGRFARQPGSSGTPPLPHESAKAESELKPPAHESTDAALCRVAAGDLSAARKRIATLLSQPEWDMDEMVKLLAAIARRDGKSFDEIIATFPEDQRLRATAFTLDALASEPELVLKLLEESAGISRVGLENRIHVIAAAIRECPETFGELLESGKLSWSGEAFNAVLRRTAGDSRVTDQILRLCKSGQVTIDDDRILKVLAQGLFYPDLQKLIEGTGQPGVMAILEQEMKARPFFQNPDANPEGWKTIGEDRLSRGVNALVVSPWLSTIPWEDIPASVRPKLSEAFVESGYRSRMPQVLESLKGANLATGEKNAMLKKTAESLFATGDVDLAVDFANAISNSEDGSNAGQDLIVGWVSYDPERAKAYVRKAGSTPLSDRIWQRILEVSP